MCINNEVNESCFSTHDSYGPKLHVLGASQGYVTKPAYSKVTWNKCVWLEVNFNTITFICLCFSFVRMAF